MTMPPYCAVTAGPINHSPPPIADPAIINPGPSNPRNPQRNDGASGSSPTSHGGIQPADTCSGASAAGGVVVSAIGVVSRIRFNHTHADRVLLSEATCLTERGGMCKRLARDCGASIGFQYTPRYQWARYRVTS